MEIKLSLKTVPGRVRSTQIFLRPLLVGLRLKPKEAYISPEDDQFVWVIEGPINKINNIIRNVAWFNGYLKSSCTSPLIKRVVFDHMTPDDAATLKDILSNNTKLEIIKDATAEEKENNKTFWEKVKEKFKRE